jgi:hypothetical protein
MKNNNKNNHTKKDELTKLRDGRIVVNVFVSFLFHQVLRDSQLGSIKKTRKFSVFPFLIFSRRLVTFSMPSNIEEEKRRFVCARRFAIGKFIASEFSITNLSYYHLGVFLENNCLFGFFREK